ncbi:diaminopimelate epimerase [Victivallis sp. Marseille-Q1083]|uniref:diaminopimelate epimerase n=1 Tax=Victivallis sp. Marseille-Q1083 TaxID=2717288 RepID=UPI00158C8822|nr:diaminopimelate epimerase [Victivallis sp. Marseille-Q1083]
MKFSKWQGLGNDFIIVEPGKNSGTDFQGLAKRLCDRHFGIGADGVVTLRPLGGTAFEMRIFNADGSESEMCGNATRCVGLYIKQHKLAPGNVFGIHTPGGIIRPNVQENNTVRVDMGVPRLKRGEIPVAGEANRDALELPLQIGSRCFIGTAVSMGNPHVVIFVPNINTVKLADWGAKIECLDCFPNKTNVEFVEVISPQMVRMRVWERGCGITLACGSGSCATAVAGVLTGRTGRNVTILLDGGELQIEYSAADNHVYMTGPAREVFTGEYLERY